MSTKTVFSLVVLATALLAGCGSIHLGAIETTSQAVETYAIPVAEQRRTLMAFEYDFLCRAYNPCAQSILADGGTGFTDRPGVVLAACTQARSDMQAISVPTALPQSTQNDLARIRQMYLNEVEKALLYAQNNLAPPDDDKAVAGVFMVRTYKKAEIPDNLKLGSCEAFDLIRELHGVYTLQPPQAGVGVDCAGYAQALNLTGAEPACGTLTASR